MFGRWLLQGELAVAHHANHEERCQVDEEAYEHRNLPENGKAATANNESIRSGRKTRGL